jgi:hypothetical protein
MDADTDIVTLNADETAPFIAAFEDEAVWQDDRAKDDRQDAKSRILQSLSLGLLLISVPILASCLWSATDHQCTQRMSTWSPMLDVVKYGWRQFKPSDGDPYNGRPTQDSEKNWDELWKCKKHVCPY